MYSCSYFFNHPYCFSISETMGVNLTQILWSSSSFKFYRFISPTLKALDYYNNQFCDLIYT